MSNIIDFYDPIIHTHAGTAEIDRSALLDRFQAGLLHLVYWVIYDKEGRDFLRANRPSDILSEAQVRADLKSKFEEYNVIGAAQEAMIAMHFAGLAWVDAFNAGDTAERDKQEAIFKQQLAAITWFLWEEGTGPLFALPW